MIGHWSLFIDMTIHRTHKFDNIVGKKIGDLEILATTPYYVGNQRKYKCDVKCHRCGQIYQTEHDCVLRSKSGMCKKCCYKVPKACRLNNPRTLDLTGKTFGKLKALHIDTTTSGRIRWIFQCECGCKKSIQGRHVTHGKITSCGCDQHGSGKKSKSWKGYEDISGKYWNQLIRNAKERDLIFSLTLDKAWDIFLRQDKKCALTGTPISLQHPKTASLDRIDSTKGYTENNVQWVHIEVNFLKTNLPESKLFYWCQKIIDHQNEKSTNAVQPNLNGSHSGMAH